VSITQRTTKSSFFVTLSTYTRRQEAYNGMNIHKEIKFKSIATINSSFFVTQQHGQSELHSGPLRWAVGCCCASNQHLCGHLIRMNRVLPNFPRLIPKNSHEQLRHCHVRSVMASMEQPVRAWKTRGMHLTQPSESSRNTHDLSGRTPVPE